ncbi:NAD(+)/NADH kinase [Termitidicoccus mucosus]|uniref:NAD kinase n=1 Tax=Termitidicoccus mucosus TaxID=1184151 RepID=A0A178IIM0_9BACT|nr:ATP-NAD kinase [Opitutaceae bacterium TSB47]
MPAAIRTLALVVNAGKNGASEIARDLMDIAAGRGVNVRSTHEFPLPVGLLKDCDACCVIGGDGTLLGVVGEAAREQVPIIGVNRGSLGFLTTFSAEEARAQFDALLEGRYCLAWRSLLDCSIGDQHVLALNDILIKEQRNSSIVRLEVRADDELVADYHSDGLIFSTPTGSTAYNLSAGGPLIHPGAEVIALTPICPHTLSNRSIVFHHDVKLRVINRDPATCLLVAADGHHNLTTCSTEPISISLAPVRLPLAQSLDYSHFSVIRTKLRWSGGAANRE